jgi:hypothetical protein
MADAFAPQLGTEVRFNQPVETPSAFGALAELGSFFVGNLADSQRKQATAAPKVDTNLATFRTGLEKVEAIRQERGETAALVAERQLASNFAMAGINFDAAYEDIYTTTTGRQWAGYGQDVEATMLQETLKDPQVQTSYIASFAVNKDWTQEQRLEYAIGQKATLEAANNEIAKSKAQAGYQWSIQTEAAYATAADTFLNTSLGSLATNVQQGGRVSPMDVQNLKAQWGQLKISLSRPSNISDDQWKSTQDKFANIDSLLTTFEKASSSDILLEEFTTALAATMTSGGDGSVESMLAGMAAIKDPATVANLAGIDFSTYIMGIGKGNLNVEMTQQDLFGHILDDQGSLTGVEDPNSFLSTIPDTVKTNIEGKTPEQIFNGLDASGKLTGLVKPADLIRPDAREQFVTNAATIGAVLMNNPSEEFLSDSFLKQLVANPGFIRNVIALDVIDPEGATVARQYIRSGLNTERGRQVTNFGTIEAFLSDKGIVWNGSAYELSPEAQGIAGAVTGPGRRGFAPMPTIAGMAPLPMDPLQEFSGVIKQAMDRRAAIGTIDSALKALEVPVEGGAGNDRLGGGQGSDTLRGAGSGSTSTNIGASLGIDFTTLEAENGLPAGFLERTAFLESGGNPRAKNPDSSAGGLFQQIDDNARAYGVKDRFDPVQSTDGAVDFAVDNMRILTAALGREPTAAELYLAHQQGGEGARRLLVNPNAKAVDVVGADAVRLNRGDVNMTAGEFASLWLDKFNNTKTTSPTDGTPANANAVASRSGEAVRRAVSPSAGPASVDVNLSSGASPTAPVEAAMAALPEAIPTEAATGTQGASELSPAIALDKDVQAFIQEIAGDPDKTYASEAEFVAAQEAGELEPGDTVVVNGEIYVVRKNGLIRRLGTVNS